MFDRIKVDYSRRSIHISCNQLDRLGWAKELLLKMKVKKHWTKDQYIHCDETKNLFSTLTEEEIPPQFVRAIKSLNPVSVQYWVRLHKTTDHSDGYRPYAYIVLASGHRYIIGRQGYCSAGSKVHVITGTGKYLPCWSTDHACRLIRALENIVYAPLMMDKFTMKHGKAILSGELCYG